MQKHHAERKPKWAYGGIYGLRSWCWRNPRWQPPKDRRRADPTAPLPSQPSPVCGLIKGRSWHLPSSDLGSGKSSSLETKVSAGGLYSCYMIPLVYLLLLPLSYLIVQKDTTGKSKWYLGYAIISPPSWCKRERKEREPTNYYTFRREASLTSPNFQDHTASRLKVRIFLVLVGCFRKSWNSGRRVSESSDMWPSGRKLWVPLDLLLEWWAV